MQNRPTDSAVVPMLEESMMDLPLRFLGIFGGEAFSRARLEAELEQVNQARAKA